MSDDKYLKTKGQQQNWTFEKNGILSHKGGTKTEKRYRLGPSFRRRTITNPYFLTKGNQKINLPNTVQEQIEN